MMWYTNGKARAKSLRSVDKQHRAAIKLLVKNRMENNKEDDCGYTDPDEIVISQYDLVLTQWAFIGVLLTRPRRIGFGAPTNECIQSFLQHMFMLGKELGVEDEFNLCNGDVETVIRYAEEIEKLVIKPALELNFNYHNMSEHMLQGASRIIPFIDPAAFKAWIYNIFDVENQFNKQKTRFATWKSTILYWIQLIVFDIVFHYELSRKVSIPIFNALMRLGIYLANHYKYLIAEEPKKLNVILFTQGVLDYIRQSI